jgi:predicted amidohydrolase YtcJ
MVLRCMQTVRWVVGGACLLQHYSDQPGWGGFLLRNKSHYDSLAQVLSKTNFQMCTHAIGDSANREILNIYNKYLQPGNDKRWRIEHAQIVAPEDFNLFGKVNVVPLCATHSWNQ